MLKRFKPTQPDGTLSTFFLPETYIGGSISVFINGQLQNVENNEDSPFGYTLNESNGSFTFYQSPYSNDSLYILYDSDGGSDSKVIDWTKKIIKKEFLYTKSNKIRFNISTIKKVFKLKINNIKFNSKPNKLNWSMKPKTIKFKTTKK